MSGQYMHAVMHTLEDSWDNGAPTKDELNIALNSIVLGMLIASTTPDTAQKLLDDAEAMVPGMLRDFSGIHMGIVGAVEHPEKWDCLVREPVEDRLPDKHPFDALVEHLFGAHPG